MDLKEKLNKLKKIEDDLVVKLEDTINKSMFDEANKIVILLMNIQKLKLL